MRYNHFDMLPERAFLKVGGQIKPQGGGGTTNTPTSTQTNTTSIPGYVQPYVESALGQTAALTDINQNPYQPYTGQRYAGFTPLQNQAFQGIAGMQPSSQIQQGTDIAGQLGTTAGGLGSAYAAQATDPNAVAGYMSPYMQNAVDVQKREANRAYDIAGAQQQSQATRAGAFGGSREALMAAENERNRNLALQGIQAVGTQQAYDKGIQSLQFGNTLGLQGLQTGMQAANTLGQLGNLQYGQEMGINQAQLSAGAQQQAQQQKDLDFAYQQYQESLNYPYKQLAFQSDLFRGLPLSQSTQTAYQATPPDPVPFLTGGTAVGGTSFVDGGVSFLPASLLVLGGCPVTAR